MDLGKLNILVVENDNDMRELIVKEFRSLNHFTDSASNYHNAKKLIKDLGEKQDLFLIDLQLPDGDGFSLVQRIREVNKDAAIIIITVYINNKIMNKAIKNNCYDLIEKPFTIKTDIIPVFKRCINSVFLKKENEYLNKQILHNSKLAALGELSATIVHDVRGPLTTIQLTCEDIKDEFKKSNRLTEETLNSHLSQIERACHKINKLVDHVRNYSRKDEGEREENKSIMELIENSLFLVKQKIRNHNIKVSIKIDEKLTGTEIRCFPNKFEQILMNLMSNACDAMKQSEEKELSVRAIMEKNFLLLSVSDTGSGIPEEIKPKIFDSFYTTKPNGEGTGLGLSIVKNIVVEHSGEILLDSIVGKGSTFTIKLPASKLV
jgi:two-component system, NtrC family, sensor kinase